MENVWLINLLKIREPSENLINMELRLGISSTSLFQVRKKLKFWGAFAAILLNTIFSINFRTKIAYTKSVLPYFFC